MTMNKLPAWFLGVCLLIALSPALAVAHPHHAHADGFVSGWAHPLTGWDHLLAMVGVGLLAARRAAFAGRLMLPATFLVAMGLGLLIGTAGAGLATAEVLIVASVFVVGALLAMRQEVWPLVVLGVLAIAGGAHGYAHGAEASGGGAAYAAGVLVGTVLLHAAGLAVGLLLMRTGREAVLRGAGAAMAATFAVVLLVG